MTHFSKLTKLPLECVLHFQSYQISTIEYFLSSQSHPSFYKASLLVRVDTSNYTIKSVNGIYTQFIMIQADLKLFYESLCSA